MNDEEFEKQKSRVQTYFDKWFKPLGMGWFEVDVDWLRSPDEDLPNAAATTTFQWQYRQAGIKFFLPIIATLSDDKLEGVVVHEFAHILTSSMSQNAPEEYDQQMEFGTETVARALIWARKAGEDSNNA